MQKTENWKGEITPKTKTKKTPKNLNSIEQMWYPDSLPTDSLSTLCLPDIMINRHFLVLKARTLFKHSIYRETIWNIHWMIVFMMKIFLCLRFFISNLKWILSKLWFNRHYHNEIIFYFCCEQLFDKLVTIIINLKALCHRYNVASLCLFSIYIYIFSW